MSNFVAKEVKKSEPQSESNGSQSLISIQDNRPEYSNQQHLIEVANSGLYQTQAIPIQLKELSATFQGGNWILDGRPEFIFKKSLTTTLIDEWNEYTGENLPANANLDTERLARCHITSWENIRGTVANWLNGGMTDNDFKGYVQMLYQGNTSNQWFTDAKDEVENVIHYKAKGQLLPFTVMQLCKELNSCPFNLRLGETVTNSTLQSHFDPVVLEGDNGYEFDDPTRAQLKHYIDHGETVSFKFSGDGKSIMSSCVSGWAQISDFCQQDQKLIAKAS